jgi:hypothetical protein
MAPSAIYVSSSVFTGSCPCWLATMSWLTLHGPNSWSLTPCPLLASTGHYSFPPLLKTANHSLLEWVNQSQSQSYVTTDRQSVGCLGVKHSSGAQDQFFFLYCQTVASLLLWGIISDERTVLTFTMAADPRQLSHSRVRVRRDSWLYLTLRFETPPTWRVRSAYLFPPEAR